MKRVILKRLESGPAGTFGLLVIDRLALHTIELPHHKNAAYISCINPGGYYVAKTFSPKFKRLMYLLFNVKGRSGIRFHSANWAGDKSMGLRSQVLGCIALGLNKTVLSGQVAVSSSRAAMKKFEEHMQGQRFALLILPEKQ